MTASPVGSMLATSNVGTPSPLSRGGGDPISASMTAFVSDSAFASEAALRSCGLDAGFGIAAAANLASTGGSPRMYWMAKTTPAAAMTANRATNIRLIDMAVMLLTPAWPSPFYTFSSKEGTDSHSEDEVIREIVAAKSVP
jgi:hypothetical protein